MRNIIIILLVLIIPICTYLFLSNESTDYMVMANDKNHPNLLIYTATMCLDCKKMKEIISEIESDYSDKINFISINALDNNTKIQDSIKKHDVKVVPTIVFTDTKGEATNKIEGFIPKEELIVKIKEAINE